MLHVNHKAQELKYALDRKASSMGKCIRCSVKKDTDRSCWVVGLLDPKRDVTVTSNNALLLGIRYLAQ